MAGRWLPGRPPGTLGGRLYLPSPPTVMLLMPPRADLHVRGSPKPPDFLSTPPDLLLAQAFKPPQSPVPLPTPTKLFSNQAGTGKLQVDLNSEHNTPVIDIQKPSTTAQQALGDLGAQGTTVLARVNDPSPISLEQPGTLANTTSSTDPILGQKWPPARGGRDDRKDERAHRF